jgi:hypothetical protein
MMKFSATRYSKKSIPVIQEELLALLKSSRYNPAPYSGTVEAASFTFVKNFQHKSGFSATIIGTLTTVVTKTRIDLTVTPRWDFYMFLIPIGLGVMLLFALGPWNADTLGNFCKMILAIVVMFGIGWWMSVIIGLEPIRKVIEEE